MPSILIRNATLLVTMDDRGQRWSDGAVYLVDNVVQQVGPTASLPSSADRVIDASGLVLVPGLVNTHHHFFQSLTRAMPGAQNAVLFDWLKALYPVWANLTAEAIRVSSQIAMAELMLSGCTTSSDHTYLWPNGASIDDQIEAAQTMGIRFHAGRGAMSLGESRGGLPPDRVVEDEAAILRDTRHAIELYHEADRFGMVRVAVAPCSPFSVTLDLMRESRELALAYGVHLHTHLAETHDEEEFCLATFRRRPAELMEDLGWVGENVWHAHVVHVSPAEAARLGQTRTGAAHCPSSNMRLASGVAPIRALIESGVRLGLGVDGSASNDGGHLLGEARQAMLLARVSQMDPAALTAEQAMHLATRGGAAALGRDDIGYLAPGMAADLVGFRLDTLGLAGAAVHDPFAALIFSQPAAVDLSVINGRIRIEHGRFVDLELEPLIARHNQIARTIARGETP